MKSVITIVIPARNEEETIVKTLDALQGIKTPSDILVVSDKKDPRDTTEQIVKRYAIKHPHARILLKKFRDRNGFAAALKRGIQVVKTPYIVFVMADACDDPHTIDAMYHKAKTGGWDVVCASRYMRGGRKIGGPFVQGVCSRIVNWSLSMATGIPTHDLSNSFKLYKRAILRQLFIDEMMGAEVSLSLISQAYAHGAKITELPTVWRGRTAGNSKFRLLRQLAGYSKEYIRVFTQTRERYFIL